MLCVGQCAGGLHKLTVGERSGVLSVCSSVYTMNNCLQSKVQPALTQSHGGMGEQCVAMATELNHHWDTNQAEEMC